jgi:TetR/AcrR family transcriptional regulator
MSDRFEFDLESLASELELYDNPLTEKQRDILRAAEDLFAKKGFAGTPTAEIAREAGVTEKTLFKHFPTKVDLFKRVLFPVLLKTLLPVQFQKLKKILNKPHHTFGEAFAEIARDRLGVVLQHGPRIKLVILELMQNDTFRKKFAAIWHEHVWNELLASVEKFQKNGQIRGDMDAAAVARVQFYVVAGFVLTRSIFHRTNSEEENEIELQKLLKIVREGIAVKE